MLYTLMYSSVAVFALHDSEMDRLLSDSRERNVADDITGLLVYFHLDAARAAFLQVLEGPQEAVERTYGRIERDELHQDLTVLVRSPLETPRFRQWSMKFAALDEPGLRAAAGDRGCSDAEVWLRDRTTMEQVLNVVGET